MPEAIIFLIVSLLLFLLFTEIITVRVIYGDVKRIDVDLMLLGISFIPKEQKKKTKQKKKRKRRIGLSDLVMEYLPFILGHSQIKINKFSVLISQKEPMSYALARAGYISLLSSAFLYINNYSKKFSKNNIIVSSSGNNKTELSFDATIEMSLISFILCVVKLVT